MDRDETETSPLLTLNESTMRESPCHHNHTYPASAGSASSEPVDEVNLDEESPLAGKSYLSRDEEGNCSDGSGGSDDELLNTCVL